MLTPRNSKLTTLRNKSLVSAAVVATVVALAASPANAMHFGGGGFGGGGFHGFGGGHMGGGLMGGGFHGMGGFHSLGGLHSMGGGLSHATTGSLSHSLPSHSTFSRHANGDRDVGGGMRERAGTGRHADRDVGGGMRERAGTGRHEDRDVGGGMRERAGTGRLADRDVGGGMRERFGTGRHEARDFGRGTRQWSRSGWWSGWTSDGDSDSDWLQYIPGVIPDVPVADGVFGPPNSGSTTYDGTTVKVVGIGTDRKTVTRTDKNGRVTVVTDPPAVPADPPAADLGTALTNLINAANDLSAAQAEAKSAHRSLDSIVSSDNLPDDVKANIPDAIKRASDADKAVKAAARAFQQALIEYQVQLATGGMSDGKADGPKNANNFPPAGHASVPDGNGGWKQYVPANDGPFGPPNSGSTTYDGTTIKVVGIGTDGKTVTRTDNTGKVTVVANPPLPPRKPAADLGTAITNLNNAIVALSAAEAESKSAHVSLSSIVSSDDLPDDVKANIPDAIKRASDADKALKDAKRAFQLALVDFQVQAAQAAAR